MNLPELNAPSPTVRLALPLERCQVLQLVARVSPQQALAWTARPDTGQFQGLFVAEQGGQTCAAVWLQRQGRQRGLVWPPQVEAAAAAQSHCDARLAGALLLDAVNATARTWELTVLQALLPYPEPASDGWFDQAGWQAGDVLEFLVAAVRPSCAAPEPLAFRPVADPRDEALAAVVRNTYERTLDCVCLEGLIDADDALADYATLGAPREDRFWLASLAGQDVGCLILADHAENDQAELVYMGLTPQSRGQGWGRKLLEHAFRVAGTWQRKQIVLAVDARNWPAREQYQAAGFWQWDSRRVWLKRL